MTGNHPNQPVRELGPIAIVRMPILSLEYLQAQLAFEQERDLSKAPMPTSGDLRKALHHEQQAQTWELRAVPRRIEQPGEDDQGVAYTCPRCDHVMLFDMTWQEASEFDGWWSTKCDRCGSVGGMPPPSRWKRELG